jgi:hypothetical protein
MKLSASWETTSHKTTQDFPNVLWNSQVQYGVHKSPPLVPILSHSNPVNTTISYLRSYLILSSYLRLVLPSGLFPSGFRTKILYAGLFSPCVLHALPISSSLTSSFYLKMAKRTSYEAPHYAVKIMSIKRDSGMATGNRLDGRGSIPIKGKSFLFSITSEPALGLTQPPTQSIQRAFLFFIVRKNCKYKKRPRQCPSGPL